MTQIPAQYRSNSYTFMYLQQLQAVATHTIHMGDAMYIMNVSLGHTGNDPPHSTNDAGEPQTSLPVLDVFRAPAPTLSSTLGPLVLINAVSAPSAPLVVRILPGATVVSVRQPWPTTACTRNTQRQCSVVQALNANVDAQVIARYTSSEWKSQTLVCAGRQSLDGRDRSFGGSHRSLDGSHRSLDGR